MGCKKNKEEFINYIFRKRGDYTRTLCKNLQVLKEKKETLNEALKKSEDKKSKERLKEEVKRITIRIKETKHELQGTTIKRCLEQVENMKGIKKVTYQPKLITILTEDIFVKGNNWGKYIIKVDYQVRIKREDGYSYGGKCHTFIRGSSPCFGVWNPTINNALSNGGIYTVIVASLKLLRCTKYDTSGGYISPSSFYKHLSKRSKGSSLFISRYYSLDYD